MFNGGDSQPGLNPLLVAGKYSTCSTAVYATRGIAHSRLNPLLVAGKYSTTCYRV